MTPAKVSPNPVNYTDGNIVRNLWDLGWPMMLSMILFAVPSAFDGLWLGKLGSRALSAAGLAMSLRITMISPLMALSMAGGAVVARYVGSRDQENADKATLHVVLLMVVSSGIIGIAGLVFKESLLYFLMGARNEVLSLAISYIRIIFIGLIAMEMVPSLAGVFNAAGSPKVPLRINMIVAGSMIAFEPFLVLGAGSFSGFGIAGAALALIIANTLGMFYAFYVLFTGRANARINLHSLRLDGLMFRRIIRIALPALIYRGTLNFAQTIIFRLIHGYGHIPSAAYSLFRRVIQLALMPCMALTRVAGVMVGQNLGADKPERSERAAYIVVGAIVLIASFLILLLSLFARPVVRIFNDEPELIAAVVKLIWILGIGQIIYMVNLAMEMSLAGAADTVSPMIISITVTWIIQLPLIYLLSQALGMGTNGIWIALVVGPLVQCAATTLRFRQGRWKLKRI